MGHLQVLKPTGFAIFLHSSLSTAYQWIIQSYKTDTGLYGEKGVLLLYKTAYFMLLSEAECLHSAIVTAGHISPYGTRRVDVATYRRTVNGAESVDLELSMTLPLCSHWEPLMGRLDSVKLQLRMAVVWLITSTGSVMMLGAWDKQRVENKLLSISKK